ncbi:MAG TPA: hypothetical protein VGF33_05710 [Caulobacteraceae bacterium]|jgi:hypothetical protein
MIRWFLDRQLRAFQRQWGYDAAYMSDMLAADPSAVLRFGMATSAIGRYRKGVPPAPWFAAGLVSVMAEDCGPCSQLAVDMALDAGVGPAVLRAVVERDFVAMPAEVALAVRYADACLAHAPQADEIRDDIVRLWGKRGLISLAFAITAARIYPTVKYALGHGRACVRLNIAGETRAVRPVLHVAA